MSTPDPMVPPALLERFEPLGILGAGNMGAVFRMRDRDLGREVALKVLHSDMDDADLEARFLREAQVLATLVHPNIVRIFDYGVSDEQPYLVMECLEGRAFDRLGEGAPWREGWFQVGQALAAVHEAGVVHRDVKPGNAILTPDGRAVLIDFGLMKAAGHRRLTKTGTVVGSLGYMAPELLTDGQPSPASDWYAWAAGLFFLREGRFPFGVDAVKDVLARRPRRALQFSTIPGDDPDRPVLVRILAEAPAQRPQNWEEVQRLFATATAVGARSRPTARPSLPSQKVVNEAPQVVGTRRSRTALTVASLLGLVLLGATLEPTSTPSDPLPVQEPTAPPTPPTEVAATETAALLRAVETLDRRLEVGPGGAWLHPEERGKEDLERHAEVLADPRLPLAITRFLEASAAWIRAIAGTSSHLAADFRDKAHADHARHVVWGRIHGMLDDIQNTQRFLLGSPSVLGRKPHLLRTMETLNTESQAAVLEFLVSLERDLGELPPLFIALSAIHYSRGRQPEQVRRWNRSILAVVREVPTDTPHISILLHGLVQYLRLSLPAVAKEPGSSDAVARCQTAARSLRTMNAVSRRCVGRLMLDGQRFILSGFLKVAEAAHPVCAAASSQIEEPLIAEVDELLERAFRAATRQESGGEELLSRTRRTARTWGRHLPR